MLDTIYLAQQIITLIESKSAAFSSAGSAPRPGGIMEYYKEAPLCLFHLCNVPFQAGLLRDCFGTVTAGWKQEMEKAGGKILQGIFLIYVVFVP